MAVAKKAYRASSVRLFLYLAQATILGGYYLSVQHMLGKLFLGLLKGSAKMGLSGPMRGRTLWCLQVMEK